MVKRIIVWLLAILFTCGITACGSVRFTSPVLSQSVSKNQNEIHQSGTPSNLPAFMVSAESVEEYQYGRFTVKVSPSGQEVVGGVFTPSPSKPLASTAVHALFINYTTKELSYYKRTSLGTYEPIIGYAVVTPLPHALPREAVQGKVLRINTAPTWCPPQSVRRKYPELPPGCLPFGDPQNAMGAAKFEIAWSAKGFEIVRLHGTHGYPRGNFWDEETFGCTRLHNEKISELIALLGPRAVEEGIEIIAFKGTKIPEKVSSNAEFIAD